MAGINYDALEQVVSYMHERNYRPHSPYSPQSQRQESGIHVNSLLRDRHSYTPFPHSLPEIWFGKCSGISNLQYLFEHLLKRPLERSQYEQLRSKVKAIALEQNRSFSAEEVLELMRGDGWL